MTKNNYIIKKTYVAPFVAFDEMEEEELMFGASANTTGTGGNEGQDDDDWGNGAKEATGDFVFELDEVDEGGE
jgi:hypothetical protein